MPRMPIWHRSRMAVGSFVLALFPAVALLGLAVPTRASAEDEIAAKLAAILQDLPADQIPGGILYDRVLPFSRIQDHQGDAQSRPATVRAWRQMYDEIRRASVRLPAWPSLSALSERVGASTPRGVIPLAILDCQVSRIRDDALATGALLARGQRLQLGSGDPFRGQRVFAFTPWVDRTYRGSRVAFRLDHNLFFSRDENAAGPVAADFGDGQGFTPLGWGEDRTVHYLTTGDKTIRLRFAAPDGTIRYASSIFRVEQLDTPAPNDSMHVVATIPYLGQYGSGEAYVDLSPQHSQLTNPVVVVEGFDPDNSMNWPELYALLNRQQLLDQLGALGFDAVVLNFTNGGDYIQRNAFVVSALIQQVQSMIDPTTNIAVIGASMGGLCCRYALAYMETHALSDRVRTFISFDSPQAGADIPLGIQYWVAFFADQSSEVAALLAELDTPAARQMVVYHHTDPPGGTGQSDPLRAAFLNDLAAVGEYPTHLRKVAIANGSGTRMNQGFNPGDQLIRWEYSSFLVDITGDIWAVPQTISHTIFHGLIDIIFLPPTEQYVTVTGTAPYDGAPGGYRDTMAQMDTTTAPYGDIVALHPNHCFIPSISSLDLNTSDLFYDIEGDPNILSKTPFDAVYFPAANQDHVEITAENAVWFLNEIQAGASAVAPDARPIAWVPAIDAVLPNPVSESARIRVILPQSGAVTLSAFDPAGREVARIAGVDLAAGAHWLSWDGCGRQGTRLNPGVYFLSLRGQHYSAGRKLILK